MRLLTITGLLLAASLALTAQAAAPPELEPLTFLLGEWIPAETDQSGATGQAEFTRELQDRVIIRTSSAEYPATAQRPALRHEDLIVIYAAGGAIRAEYYDNEGNVIHYVVTVPEPGHAILISEPSAGQPRFRLTYLLEANGVLKGAFDIAAPGAPEEFRPYLAWENRKAR